MGDKQLASSRWVAGEFVALLAAGCASLTATPPQVEVRSVTLRGVGLLDQALEVELCVTNPNDALLDFRGVTAGVDVGGMAFAEAASEAAVMLPPHSSTLVPFEVVTTLRNLGPRLLGIFKSGSVDYRIHGAVELTGALHMSITYSHGGRLSLLSAAQEALGDSATPRYTHCEPALT